ncbi:MAG: hypothetical protein WA825_10820 [Steroidobacteraceae bacterium]
MSFNSASLRRELLWALIALPVGVLLLPPLIWVVGSRVFGTYAGGGTRDLIDHFFRGLAQGQEAFWIVALGPYLALIALRMTLGAVRATRRQA